MDEKNPYDIASFESFPTPERGVWRLQTVARVLGRNPPDPSRCRVLDMGCGSATLLLTMASELPNSFFVGIDNSQTHMARAQEFLEELGLNNVRLLTQDLSAISLSDEKYDYIFAYGMYSWFPRNMQSTLLSAIKELLAPQGLAAISFNPWPGFHSREIVGSIVRSQIGAAESYEPDYIKLAREHLSTVFSSLLDSSTAHAQHVREEISRAIQLSDAHLYYTLLSPRVSSCSLSTFVKDLDTHGLEYLVDSRPRNWLAIKEGLKAEPGKGASANLSELAKRECSLDLITPSPFRTAIIEHKESGEITIDPYRIKELYVSSHLIERESIAPTSLRKSTFYAPDGTEIPTTSDIVDSLLRTFEKAWPARVSVQDLIASAPAVTTDELLTHLINWYLSEMIELDCAQIDCVNEISEKPTAYLLARVQARHQEWITTCRHGYIEVDPFAAAVTTLCDGTRTLPGIASEILSMRGGTLPDGVSIEQLTEAVQGVLEHLRESAVLNA